MNPRDRSSASFAQERFGPVMFEMRLVPKVRTDALSFVLIAADERDAVTKARRIWDRHPEYDVVELWNGMKMLRQL